MSRKEEMETRKEAESGRALGHTLVLALAGIPMLSAWLGWATGQANLFAWLPLAVAFVLVPAISLLWGMEEDSSPPALASSSRAFRFLPRLAVPAQLCALVVALSFWSGNELTLSGQIGWALSGGLFSALLAASAGHELIHRDSLLDRGLGGLLLSTICFGSFKIVHPQIHHRFVGTPLDFASAPRGLSLYGFLPRCLLGNIREALRLERKRLARGVWRTELTLWYGLSLFWSVAALLKFGWNGAVYFVFQSLIACVAVDWTNYLQHYGLRRRMTPSGHWEPVQPRHAWSIRCRASNLAMLNLFRHGDHHAHPDKPYQCLSHEGSPDYPYPLGIMFLLPLATPLFRRVVHPRLDRIEAAPAETAR